MATVEEEILLHEPEDPGFDNLSALDEDLLLGAGDISRKSTQDTADDALLEAPGPVPEQKDDEKEHKEQDPEDVESEKEELDYDEEEDDEERRERTSRYTSEKKRVHSAEGDENKEENGKPKRSGIPSLFDKTITNNPLISGDKPIGVILRIEGEQERVFYPPPNFMNEMNPQNIVPRLPNGIPLVGMPSNHGRAGFGQSYRERLTGGGGVPDPQWHESVAMFLNNVKPSSRSRTRKRRSSSYSRSSSSSSSRSRSSSRDRRRRKEPRRERRSDRRRHEESRRRDEKERERDRRRRELESAKALGLSSEYMEQVNEQKRKREEVVRKKEERRHGEKVAPAPAPAPEQKTKAYLVVNVTGVKELPTAVKKIEAMATELGPIKKCWRSAEDTVSIIFNAHDKAKVFMIEFNGKVLSGLRITVSLEKKFLSLNEVN